MKKKQRKKLRLFSGFDVLFCSRDMTSLISIQIQINMIVELLTVLFVESIDVTGTMASSETVRRMHDDSAALSNNCDLPLEFE